LIKRILKVVLVVIAIAAVAFVVFWFSRPADLIFAEARASLPNSDYSLADSQGPNKNLAEQRFRETRTE
jgi:hypothetical protein